MFRNTNLCDLMFRNGLRIDKRGNFMIFIACVLADKKKGLTRRLMGKNFPKWAFLASL